MLPHFIIIGAQKAGTTSLYKYLSKHPSIIAPEKKEVHFYDDNFTKGLKWYRRHFPTVIEKFYYYYLKKAPLLTGESTPYYLFHPWAPQRIAKTIPNVKIIALLRNPVDRAYSHYQHNLRREREPLSFEDAIAKEQERLAGEKNKMLDNDLYYSFPHKHYSYLSRGIYVNQLKVWMDLFSPHQFLIIISEHFYANTSEVFLQTLKFLDLPSWEPETYHIYNTTPYKNVSKTTRKKLIDYYRPYNEKLYDTLDLNLSWDK